MSNVVTLPSAAPARVLAVGAWLKNTACLLDGRRVHWSALHGDLGTPDACRALEASVEALLAAADGPLDAIAHDLHPDFPSTQLAIALAARLQVPAVPVQHHHAHIGVVQAELGRNTPVIGIALDGVGLGADGNAWGGELLRVAGADWRRLDHLTPLALPGGDAAARDTWRMAASALYTLGRGDEIVPRYGHIVGKTMTAGVHKMLQRGLNCPMTTSAGRWFDAAAGLLGLSVKQSFEAEAAIALEKAATAWLATHADPTIEPLDGLDLRPLATALVALADAGRADEGAAQFHLALARALAAAAIAAARHDGIGSVALGGGCFLNRLLGQRLADALQAAGLTVHAPRRVGPGDAGLALGQAWIAAHTVTAPMTVVEMVDVDDQVLPCA
ncbi:MAG TPA: carbamoyltransferase HypF [Albitalea sp.]|nr:carbamoyltransferase HypF [Albitalea sp.]